MAFPLFAHAPRRLSPGDGPRGLPLNTRSPAVLGAGAAAVRARSRGRRAPALDVRGLPLARARLVRGRSGAHGLRTAGRRTGSARSAPASRAAFVTLVGVVAWVLPLEALLLGIPFVRGEKSLATPARLAGDLLIVVIAAALVQVGWAGQDRVRRPRRRRHGRRALRRGRALALLDDRLVPRRLRALGLILIGRATFSFIALMRWLARLGARARRERRAARDAVADAWETARELEREEAPRRERIADAAASSNSAPNDEATIAIAPGATTTPTASSPTRRPKRRRSPSRASRRSAAQERSRTRKKRVPRRSRRVRARSSARSGVR